MDYILNQLLLLQRGRKQLLLICLDTVLLIICFCLSMWLRLDSFAFALTIKSWTVLIAVIPLTLSIFIWLGLYRAVLRYITLNVLQSIGFATFASSIVMFTISQLFTLPIPRSVPGIYFLLTFLTIGSTRFILQRIFSTHRKDTRKSVVIYGAGEAGRQLLNALKQSSEYRPVFFIDDNPSLFGTEISGLRVFNFQSAHPLFEDLLIHTVLLAIPSASIAVRSAVIKRLETHALEIKTMPGIADIIEGKVQISSLRNVTIEDLLEREIIPPKPELMDPTIKGKVVMVTGAGGSIGGELCRQILAIGPKRLILFDHSEFFLYSIEREIHTIISQSNFNVDVKSALGSVQDRERILTLLTEFNVQTIYHAAAYKHVPLVEKNIIEGVRNNVFGTQIVANCAIEAGVKNFILISTDKAVRPTNIMGATKRLAELLCQTMARQQTATIFSMVRFGNVMGSSGSVIPLFKEQIEQGGPVTVTHPEVTRYFMTITEAAQLVIQAGAMAKKGDVFLLDMGKPVKILDLAMRMTRLHGLTPYISTDNADQDEGDIQIVISGMRPGEKLYEELLIDNNSSTTSHPRIMQAQEKFISTDELPKLLDALIVACDENNSHKIALLLESSPARFQPIKNNPS